MMGNGKRVDLYRLFNVVKAKGGYDAVSDSKSWNSVAWETGLAPNAGPPVKLVYSKYLKVLDSRLKEIAGCSDGSKIHALVDTRDKFRKQMMDLHDEFSGLFWDLAEENFGAGGGGVGSSKFKINVDENNRASGSGGEGFKINADENNEARGGGDEEFKFKINVNGEQVYTGDDGVEGMMSLESGRDMQVENGGNLELGPMRCLLNEATFEAYIRGHGDEYTTQLMEEYCREEVAPNAVVVSDGKGIINQRTKTKAIDSPMLLTSSDSDVVISSRKRKRDPSSNMLSWLYAAATNPLDPSIGLVPDKSKWKYYGDNLPWKQVLLLREATMPKRNFESKQDQQSWLSQDSHPSLYDDDLPGAAYKFRERSPSPCTDDRAGKQSVRVSNARSGHSGYPIVDVRVGPCYQAMVPLWTDMPSESDSKWNGTRIWPSEVKVSSRLLIERDPLGKGRQDSCGCPIPGSEQCVRFHISEKSAKVKHELDLAYKELGFDKMGEEVRRLWTYEEEQKFNEVVHSAITKYADKFFWDDIFRKFPRKSREDLVSYYYNVFLYQRRGYQNRYTPDDIDSDDDGAHKRSSFERQTKKSRNQKQKSRKLVS